METDAPATKRPKRNITSESSSGDETVPAPPPKNIIVPKKIVKRKIAKPNKSMKTVSGPSSSVPKQSDQMDVLPVNATPMNVMDMNDHCLLEMMKRMELRDLCAMAECCVHLKELAQMFFATNYRNVSLTSMTDPRTGKYPINKVRQLLYNFGHLIKSLTIDFNDIIDHDQCVKLLHLIRKYSFETIDEVVFLNQPKRDIDIGVNIVVMLFGSELMLREVSAGQYRTRTKQIFQLNKMIQVQDLVQDD